MKIIFGLFILLLFSPLAYACQQTSNHIVVETGFYDYNQHIGGVAGDIVPSHYTGPSIAIGFRPFSCALFEVGYFSNGNTTRIALGSKYSVYAQSRLHFRVLIMRMIVNLFVVPFTNGTVTANGIVSVNQIRYNGSVVIGYHGPKKNGKLKLISISGEDAGPAVGIGLTYRPSKRSNFEIGARRTQYTYGHTDASLNTVFIRYLF